jgi:DNA-binding CsgD family transcriptional regulator/tetratricopeptide (TPR) repeat protein
LSCLVPTLKPGTDPPLVGRLAELGNLLRVVKEAARGDSQVVLLEGDPGTGKTRLVQELIVNAERLGARPLVGRAREFERGFPYSAIFSALDGPLGELDDDDRVKLAGLGVAELDPTFAALSPSQAGRLKTRSARLRAAAVLARLLVTWSEKQPILLAIDDAHWLDDSSIQLLHYLAGQVEASSFVLLLAYRGRPPELQAGAGALLRELGCHRRGLSMQLDPLDEWDTATLAAGLLGGAPDPSLADLIVRATGGNPFFIVEVVRALGEIDDLVVSEGRFALRPDLHSSLPIPLTARALVTRRLSRLGRNAMTVAKSVSVVESFTLGSARQTALVAASGLERRAFDGGLDDLCRAGILASVDGRSVDFVHPLVRTLIYDDLGVTERRQLHQRLADQLDELRHAGHAVSAFEVATHAAHCARHTDDVAVERLAEAGDEAIEHAPSVAADWFEQALALLPLAQISWRASLHRRRARALFLADLLTKAVAACRDALTEVPYGPERISIATILISALTAMGHYDAALSEVNLALTEGGVDGRERLLAHRVSVLFYLGRLVETRVCAAELRVDAADVSTRSLVLRELAQVALVQGRLDEHADAFAQALRLAEHLPGSSRSLIRALTASHFADLGQVAAADSLLTKAEREANDHGIVEPVIAGARAKIAWLTGRWDEAIAIGLANVEREERSGRRVVSMGIWRPLIAIATDRGDIISAISRLERVRKLEAATGAQLGSEYIAWCQARLGRLQGRPADTVEDLEVALERCRAQSAVSCQLFLLDELTAAYTEMDDRSSATRAAGELAALAHSLDLPLARALVDRARLRAFHDDEAGWRAHGIFVELSMPFERAQTELFLARRLRDPVLAESAHVEFGRLGADPWIRRTRSLFKELGLPVPRRSRKSRSEAPSLSELEGQIAELVAQGLTNRDIGGVLLLSRKTVENYLSSIYRKLGCTSRTQLAARWRPSSPDSGPGVGAVADRRPRKEFSP